MTYTKPTIEVLGNAKVLIANPTEKPGAAGDPDGTFNAPAYDLDE